MAKRKTVSVDDLRIRVNDMLRLSTCSRDTRRGMMGVLETVLHDTGNYRGFRYLEQDEVPDGALPGILREGERIISGTGMLGITGKCFPDDSRVEYYGN